MDGTFDHKAQTPWQIIYEHSSKETPVIGLTYFKIYLGEKDMTDILYGTSLYTELYCEAVARANETLPESQAV